MCRKRKKQLENKTEHRGAERREDKQENTGLKARTESETYGRRVASPGGGVQ